MSKLPRVFFVDDDPMLLASTRRQLLLQLDEVELVFCGGGQQALEEAELDPPQVIFTDVRMPDLDGPTLLGEIKKRYPDTICFAWTGHTGSLDTTALPKLAQKVLTKPCPTEQLKLLILEAIEGRQSSKASSEGT